MISPELELALHDSFMQAHAKRHRHITVEHLFLRLLDISTVRERLKSYGIEETSLRTELETQVSKTEAFPSSDEVDTQPTTRFQGTIQRAILKVQKELRPQVTPEDVLNAILGHPECLVEASVVQRRVAASTRRAQ